MGPEPVAENLIGSHLLKWVHWQQDTQGQAYDLRCFRDTDGREVDFVVCDGKRPGLVVECKHGWEQPGRIPRRATPAVA